MAAYVPIWYPIALIIMQVINIHLQLLKSRTQEMVLDLTFVTVIFIQMFLSGLAADWLLNVLFIFKVVFMYLIC